MSAHDLGAVRTADDVISQPAKVAGILPLGRPRDCRSLDPGCPTCWLWPQAKYAHPMQATDTQIADDRRITCQAEPV